MVASDEVDGRVEVEVEVEVELLVTGAVNCGELPGKMGPVAASR